MPLNGQLVQRDALTSLQRSQMLALMNKYYSNISRSAFDSDLDQKRWVILVTDPDTRRVQGFSTQTLLDVTVQGRPVRALFSGDTIVDRQYWAKNPLAREWGRLALTLIDSSVEGELYWFLISKGYKTYRFLPLFFHQFFPRFDQATPPPVSEVINAFGELEFPTSYDAQHGIVRADKNGCKLRPNVAKIEEHRLKDPHVRHFVESNPLHTEGDELCCLAPLTRQNFTPAAYRVIGQTESTVL